MILAYKCDELRRSTTGETENLTSWGLALNSENSNGQRHEWTPSEARDIYDLRTKTLSKMKTIKQHQPTSNNLKQPKEQLKQFFLLSSKEMVLDQPSTRMERGGAARPSDRGQQRVSVLYLTPTDMVRQCKQFKTMQNMQVFLAEYFAVFSCPLFQVLNCYSRICTVATDNVVADARVVFKTCRNPTCYMFRWRSKHLTTSQRPQGICSCSCSLRCGRVPQTGPRRLGAVFFGPSCHGRCNCSLLGRSTSSGTSRISCCISNVAMLFHLFLACYL